MLEVVKAKKYHLRGKYDEQKVQNFTRMAALISGHSVQKSIAIHFHPCNPVLLPQNARSILFCGIFLSNVFGYLAAFGNIMWKLENRNFFGQP